MTDARRRGIVQRSLLSLPHCLLALVYTTPHPLGPLLDICFHTPCNTTSTRGSTARRPTADRCARRAAANVVAELLGACRPSFLPHTCCQGTAWRALARRDRLVPHSLPQAHGGLILRSPPPATPCAERWRPSRRRPRRNHPRRAFCRTACTCRPPRRWMRRCRCVIIGGGARGGRRLALPPPLPPACCWSPCRRRQPSPAPRSPARPRAAPRRCLRGTPPSSACWRPAAARWSSTTPSRALAAA